MKNKRIIYRVIVTLGLLALLVVPATPAAADTPVSIDVDAQVPDGATDIIATVSIGSVSAFDAAQYDITYDPAVIEITGVTDGDIGGTPIPVSSWGYIPTGVQGTIRVINNVPSAPGVTGSGYLAEIHFDVVGSTGTTSAIDLQNGILGDSNADEIPATWTDGSVEVITAITADFYADKTEVLVGQSIAFTDNSSGGSGSYIYAWDFDNNGTTDNTTENPSYSYAAAGTKTVKLTVTDISDGSDSEIKTDYITVYDALVAGCSSDIDEAVVGQTITFTDSTLGGKAGYTYAWDFDDTGTSDLENPTHSYAASGTYTATLTVTDSLGNMDTDTVTVTVYKLGDANGDNSIDVLDLTHIEHIIMGDTGYDYTTWADAKQDTLINALDITAIELIIMTP